MLARPIYEFTMTRGQVLIFNKAPEIDFLRVDQIHSNIIATAAEIKNSKEKIKADGIVGNTNDNLCILTADCLPIFIEGKKGHAALHAGWAGVKSKICIQKEIFDIEPTHVFIGPHISNSNYEVQESFKENFLGSKNFLIQDGKLYFDLLNEVKGQFLEHFPLIEINDLNICTFQDKNLNSFRRNKTANRNFNLYLPFGDNCED